MAEHRRARNFGQRVCRRAIDEPGRIRLSSRAGPAKRARRAMKRAFAAGREAFVARVPDSVRRRLGPPTSYLHMLVADHLWIRLVYTNRRKLAEGVWRSAQPLPHQIRHLSEEGLRTIINLRGRTKTSTYDLEKAACE